MRVAIGGHELPFTNTRNKPLFAADISGAEWTVTPELRAGAVVLALTAPDQSGASDSVESVAVTEPGSGYAAAPTVTFSAPSPGGVTATGTAVMTGNVADVTITDPGTDYAAAPAVTFSAPPAGGVTAAGTATLTQHLSVRITNPGSSYTSAPTVTFSAPASGTTATGTARLAVGGFDQYQNLLWARRTLDGKQLQVQVVDE